MTKRLIDISTLHERQSIPDRINRGNRSDMKRSRHNYAYSTQRLIGKKILISGSTGFLGTHLVKGFIKEGAEVVCCARENVEFHECQYHSVNLVKELPDVLLDGMDLIVHCAGQPSVFKAEQDPIADFEANALASVRVFREADSRGIRVIYPSTIAVYGSGCYSQPLKEEYALPDTCYGMSKYVAERYLEYFNQQSSQGHIALRLSYLYGPGVKRGPIIDFLNAYVETKSDAFHFMTMESVLDFLLIDDAVEGFILAATSSPRTGGIYNLGSGKGVSLKKGLQLIEEIMGSKPPCPLKPAQIRLPTKVLVLDCQKFAKTFNWSPQTPLIDGITLLKRSLFNGE